TEAWNNLSAGDAQFLVGVADARPIESVVGDKDRAVEPDAGFIDKRRADRARPVDGDVLRTAKLRVPGRDQRNRAFVVDLIVIGERVTAGDVVFLAQARVELYVELMAVTLARRHDGENAGLIGRVDAGRQRIQGGVGEERLRHRIDDAVGGNYAAREKRARFHITRICASLRIADIHAEARKVAGPPRGRRHGDRTAATVALNDALIVDEEK